MRSICLIEERRLSESIQCLVGLEGSVLTAEWSQVVKFYQGVARYYSGEAEDALSILRRVGDMSKGRLKEEDVLAYYQFTRVNILL